MTDLTEDFKASLLRVVLASEHAGVDGFVDRTTELADLYARLAGSPELKRKIKVIASDACLRARRAGKISMAVFNGG